MKRIMYVIGLLLLGAACDVEDKGSYDYNELNGVTVDSVLSEYRLKSQIDTLRIKPELTGTLTEKSTDNYEYHWYLCPGSLEGHDHVTIGENKDLEYPVNLLPGEYDLWLQIKDRTSDIKWLTYSKLYVSTLFTKGFLLLGENENKEVRLDMLTMAVGEDTLIVENVYDNSKQHLASPREIIFTGQYSSTSPTQLWILTENASMGLTYGAAFEDLDEFNNSGIIETDEEHISPMRIQDVFPRQGSGSLTGIRNARERGYITDDMIFVTNTMFNQNVLYMAVPCNRYKAGEKLFKPYPMAFVQGAKRASSNLAPVFYDMTNECFTVLTQAYYTTPNYCKVMSDYPQDPFPWNQTTTNPKRFIVYGENGYEGNQGNCHALMKDEEGGYHIYTFRPATGIGSWNSPTKLAYNKIDLKVATDFERASRYCFSSAKTVLLYAVGSMLYAYDYSRGHFVFQDMGAEITCLEADYNSTMSLKDFFVATWDGSKGTLRKLQVGGDANALVIDELPRQVWNVTMKVIDVEWKNAQ